MSKLRALLVGAGTLLASIPAQAQTVIAWADAGTDFATGSNWIGSVPPTGDVAQFATPSPTNQPVLAANFSVDGLQFAAGAGAFTLSGAGTLSIGGSGVVDQSLAQETIAVALSFGSVGTGITNSGSLTISGAISNNVSTAALTITNNSTMMISGAVANNGAQGISFGGSGSNATVSGVISGVGSVAVTGVGKWTFSGANTYSGPTTVVGGTLLMDNATGSATSTGPVTVSPVATLKVGNNDSSGSVRGAITNNGSLDFVRSDTLLNYAGGISGPGSVAFSGTGTVTLSGANSFTGSTVVFTGSTLADGAANSFSAASFGMFVATGGILDVNFNEAVANLGDSSGAGGTVNLATGTTLSLTGSSGSSFSGTISGPGALALAGTGGSYTETLKGANTYSGGTNVTSGSLVLANGISGSATGTGPVTIGPAGTLKIGDGFSSAGNVTGDIADGGTVMFQNPVSTITYGGTLSGSGGVIQAANGTVILTGSNTYTGTTSVNGGTLILANGTTGSATGTGNVLVNGAVNLQIGNGGTAGSVQGNIQDNATDRQRRLFQHQRQ